MIVRGASETVEAVNLGVTRPLAATKELRGEPVVAKDPGIRFSGPVLVAAEKPVTNEDMEALVGGPAFLRIQRCDGRSEIVAGTLEEFSPGRISLSRFDVARAQRLIQEGDSFWIASSAGEVLKLAAGDRIKTAVALPVDTQALARGSCRRVEIRTRAQALLDGHAREGIADIEPHLVRDASGAVYRSVSDRPVIDASAAEQIKAEQNAIVMVFAKKLTAAYKERARHIAGFGEILESHRPLRALEQELLGVATSVVQAFEREHQQDPVWKRLGVVHSLMQAYVPQIVSSTGPRRLLEQGLRTPIEVLARLTEVAQHHTTGTGQRPSDALRASAPIVMKLALSHQKLLETVEQVLEDGRDDGSWNPDFFQLVDGRLELTPEVVHKLANERGVRFDALPAKTTGCPAAQTFAGANPVRDFVAMFAEHIAKLEVAQAGR